MIIKSKRIMPWSHIHIILIFIILLVYYLTQIILMRTLTHATNPLKNIQTTTTTQILLIFLQKTEELSTISSQTLQNHLMRYPWFLMMTVDKLASISIRTKPLFIKFIALSSFVLWRKIILCPYLHPSMRKITLNIKVSTF